MSGVVSIADQTVSVVNRTTNDRPEIRDQGTGRRETTQKARNRILSNNSKGRGKEMKSSYPSYSYDAPFGLRESGFGRLYLCCVNYNTVTYT